MTTPWMFQTRPWMFPNSFGRRQDQTICGRAPNDRRSGDRFGRTGPGSSTRETRDVITIARRALERQGLAGSAWDWVADLEFRPQNKQEWLAPPLLTLKARNGGGMRFLILFAGFGILGRRKGRAQSEASRRPRSGAIGMSRALRASVRIRILPLVRSPVHRSQRR
jgi:hypothetical protein